MSGVPSSPEAVDGTEQPPEGESAMAALIHFYRSFNSRDLEALADNWAQGDEPSMDNPIGGIRRGWSCIRAGYEKLFLGPARVNVQFYDYTQHAGPDFYLFVGRERGTCTTNGASLNLRIRTSRLFTRHRGAWRQLHHHGSIEEPHLLEAYQRMILGEPIRIEP